MADRYWVGGTADWDGTAASKWAATSGGAGGQTEPTGSDNVFFDGNSGANTVTIITTGATCKNLTFTGFTGTLAGSETLRISGSLTLVAGMTLSYSGAITFDSTGSETITSNGKTINSPVSISGVGGTFSLQDNLTVIATQLIDVTDGTFDANDHNVSTGIFTASGSNSRTILMGSGTWSITNASGANTVWDTSSLGGPLTLTAETSTIDISGANSSTRTVSFGIAAQVWNFTISGGSGQVNTSNLDCNDATFTSGHTGVWNSTTNPSIRGNLSMHSNNGNPTGSQIIFTATSGTKTITTGGNSIGNGILLNGVGGTWQLQDSLTLPSTATFQITNGNFDANNFNVSMGIFSSSNANARVITMGTGTWTLSGVGAITVWTTATTTNLTLNTSSTTLIDVTGVTASTRTITGGNALLPSIRISGGSGGITLTNINCDDYIQTSGYTGVMGTGAITIRGSLSLDFNNGTPTATGNAMTFAPTSGTKTINMGGKTLDRPPTFNSAGGNWQLTANATFGVTRQLTHTAGTIDLNGFTLSVGFYNGSGSTTRGLTFGSGLLTLTYAVGGQTIFDVTTATGMTVSPGTGEIRVTGANSGARVLVSDPTPTWPGLRVSAGSGGITTTSMNVNDVTFTSGWTGAWTITNATTTTIRGSLSMNSANADVASTTGVILFSATSGTKTITTGSNVIGTAITIDGAGGTFQLVDGLTMGSTRTLTLTNGTFDANNQAISTGLFFSNNSNTRSILMGSSTWTLTGVGTVWDVATSTGMTVTPSTSTIKLTNNSASSKTFSGGGLTYGNYWNATAGAGVAIMIGSNTFADLKIDAGRTQQFTAGTTTTVTTFTATGSAGNLITITSPTLAQHTLTKSGGGTIVCNYLALSYSNATPAATWFSGANSTIGASVTGWVLPTTNVGRTFLFS